MGATVSVKEKVTLGTTTDTQGKYTLKLPDNREYTLHTRVSILSSGNSSPLTLTIPQMDGVFLAISVSCEI